LFQLSSSEVPARILAFLATASIPFAIYRLRPQLGEGGALLALAFLALDGPAITLGVSASALGFDIALLCWLFVALTGGPVRPWAWAVGGFLLATGGPITLPLAGAALALLLANRLPLPPRHLLFAAGGAALGVAVASLQFGLGWGGLRIPPFDLFADGYEQVWSTPSGGALVALYSLPVIAAGLAAAAWTAATAWRRSQLEPDVLLLLGWAGLALAWLVSSLNSHNPAPVAAATVPLALVLGPAAASALTAMVRADWRLARWLLPLAALALLIALAVVVDWARQEQAGDTGERILAAAFILVAAGAIALVVIRPGTLATVTAAALVVLGLPAISSTMGVALSAGQEPINSPLVPEGARNLRDLALQLRREQDRPVVIHPDLERAMTWPFRASGRITLDSRPAPGAAILILPENAAPPAGYAPLEGDWSLQEEVVPPTGSWLTYLHWRVDRNHLAIRPVRVAVYTGAQE
jgi:hypothetical protein